MKLIIAIFIGIYLALPSPKFPGPPPNSIQSTEPADTESIYRRAYYTNLSRLEIMDYYDKAFSWPGPISFKSPPKTPTPLSAIKPKAAFWS